MSRSAIAVIISATAALAGCGQHPSDKCTDSLRVYLDKVDELNSSISDYHNCLDTHNGDILAGNAVCGDELIAMQDKSANVRTRDFEAEFVELNCVKPEPGT